MSVPNTLARKKTETIVVAIYVYICSVSPEILTVHCGRVVICMLYVGIYHTAVHDNNIMVGPTVVRPAIL